MYDLVREEPRDLNLSDFPGRQIADGHDLRRARGECFIQKKLANHGRVPLRIGQHSLDIES